MGKRLVSSKQNTLHWNWTLWKSSLVSRKCSALSFELFLLCLSFGGFNLVNTEDILMCSANSGPTLKRCAPLPAPFHLPLPCKTHTHTHYCCQLPEEEYRILRNRFGDNPPWRLDLNWNFHSVDTRYGQKDHSWFKIVDYRVSLGKKQASLVAQLVKNLPAMRETWVQSLGWEDPLEKGKATHSSIPDWRQYTGS